MMRGLYLILDPDQVGQSSPVATARAALASDAQAVQWRQKAGSFRSNWRSIIEIRNICRESAVPFLINDRVDVALAVDADGVHLGQDDLPLGAVRNLLVNKLLGVSVTSLDQIQSAVDDGADYLGVGPIFATSSKRDAVPPLGLEFLSDARQLTDLPIVAIGGINVENATQVMDAGADAIAVLSAVCEASDPGKAARDLVAAIKEPSLAQASKLRAQGFPHA